MGTSDDSLSSLTFETDVDQAPEYYEELDNHRLDFRKRKSATSIPTKLFVKELPPVPPSLSPPPISSGPILKGTSSPDPKPSVGIKQKLFNRIHQTTEPTTKTTSFSELGMSHQQISMDGFQLPPGMMLVAAPQQQPQSQIYSTIPQLPLQMYSTIPQQPLQMYPTISQQQIQPQMYPAMSQYQPHTMAHNTALKNNKVAPPPSSLNNQTVNQILPNNSFQSPSSMVSTNQLIQPSYQSKHQQQQLQQHSVKHTDQSKSSKKKQKKQSDENLKNTTKNANRSFPLYNQQNGRIEGTAKNRLNAVNDDLEESKSVDEEDESEGKLAVWFSQPLWLGLTRLSGGLLFGSMIILGMAAIAGLITSIALYTQDSVTNAQWKILGMVICAIMLITIIITLLLFVYCYKNGYMFDNNDDDDDDDDDDDAINPSTIRNAERNERPKPVSPKIYNFNRPNETPPIPSDVPHRISPSPPIPKPSIEVNDKQTNTETTLAFIRPKDFDRGVWPSVNAYGGISYRPLIPPQMISRFIQVLPHEIEAAFHPPPPPLPSQVVYQVVAPTAAIPPPQIQPRMIQIPAQQPQVVEYAETPEKQQPKTIQIPTPQTPAIEYVEANSKQQSRTIQRPAQQTPVFEYVETTQKQPRTSVARRSQQVPVQPTTHIEYVDVEDQRKHRVVQQPKYEIVEEVTDRPTSPSSSSVEVVEIINKPKHVRQHHRKKSKKRAFAQVSVKRFKSVNS